MNARILSSRQRKVASPRGNAAAHDTAPLATPELGPAPHAHDRPGSWAMSSVDLAEGVDVLDNVDTISDELFDELFVKQPA